MVSHKLLGQLLVERGLLPEDDLQKALSLQRERKGRLGKILLDLGYISQEDLQSVLSEQLGIPRVDAAELQEIPMEAATLPSTFLRQCLLYPYRVDDGTVFIGMADPLDSDNIRAIEQLMGRKVEVRLASETAILKALDVWLGAEQAEEGMEAKDSDESRGVAEAEAADIDQLRDLASEAPVIRWVNQLVARALERRSSDIHFEPFEKQFRVRYRIDGVLYEVPAPPREMQAAMGSPIAEVMIRFIEAVAIPMAAEYETRLAVVRAMAKELTKLAEKTAQAVELAAQEGRLYADARAAFIEAKAQQAALEKLRRRDGLHLVPRALKV